MRVELELAKQLNIWIWSNASRSISFVRLIADANSASASLGLMRSSNRLKLMKLSTFSDEDERVCRTPSVAVTTILSTA